MSAGAEQGSRGAAPRSLSNLLHGRGSIGTSSSFTSPIPNSLVHGFIILESALYAIDIQNTPVSF